MLTIRRGIVVVALLACVPAMRAQSVHGTVTDGASVPVAGAVVQLIDGASTIVARQLSSERGTFRITAPRAATYRLQTLRIGYTPVQSEPFALTAGTEITRNVSLNSIRVALDTVRITARSACRLERGVAQSTAAIWEQVRTALIATQISLEDTGSTATTVWFERRIDPKLGKVRAQTSNMATGPARQPWISVSPDQLRRTGYVHDDSSGTTYEAPGLDALLANSFLEDHCLQLVTTPRFGIAFEPTRDRKVAEIKGTIWLDKESLELRELDYRYANIPSEQDSARGHIEFVRMRSGAWTIAEWRIRMPALQQQSISRGLGRYRFMDSQIVIGDLIEDGGILSVYRRGNDTLFAHAPITLTGVVRDAAAERTVAGAYVTIPRANRAAVADSNGRFVIEGLLPGEYLVDVESALTDSVGSYRLRVPLLGSDSIDIRVPSAKTLAAQRPPPKAARFTGAVLVDSTRRPVSDVTVLLEDIGLSATSNERGQVDIRDVPPGVHQVNVRKLGYGKLDAAVTFAPGATVTKDLILSRIVTLDSVIVTERALLPSFEEHRRVGLGQFLTREDLAKQEGRSMAAVMGGMRSTMIMPGSGSHAMVAVNRGQRSLSGNDMRRGDYGAKPACYSNVYFDNMLYYSGRSGQLPFDINSISPDRLEAVEFYASAAQIPDKYAGLNNICGLIVLWTRRTFNDSTSSPAPSP